jgi:hypothetical protein
MKKLLIFTGPQGSGNHLWSKIFALHPDVAGWSSLLDTYWIPHDQEPFADCWRDTALLKTRDWSQHDYYVTSISCPYFDGSQLVVPNIVGFAAQAMGCGLQVKIAIIGRDQNILGCQETRVRGQPTFSIAQEEYKKLSTWNPVYLSYELLHLYQHSYLEQISKTLDFPIAYNDVRLQEILTDDTNKKYVQPVTHHWVDKLTKGIMIKPTLQRNSQCRNES